MVPVISVSYKLVCLIGQWYVLWHLQSGVVVGVVGRYVWEEIILSVLCCVLHWVWWLSHWCSFVIFMVTTLFTKNPKFVGYWLVYENFDYSSIWVCNMCNKKAKCVVYGRRMFLNVHTAHYTNQRTPNLICLYLSHLIVVLEVLMT